MSSSIDERIVSMKFDNKQFESGVKESLGTIDRLKNAMKFDKSVKNIDELNRATKSLNADNMSGIEKSVKNLEGRFSNLGIVGMTAVQNITNAAMRMAAQLGKDITKPITNAFAQIKSGGLTRAFNLEQANFQLMGLLNNSKKVAGIMGAGGPVQEAVSGTAYGLDQAAVAASQLVASGMKTNELLGPLKAIAGVASMTGRDYDSISQIFTTVASNGKLMTMQLRQLSASGLNASAALAKYLHKSEQEINEMVEHGQISFETFSNAMSKSFGENAARANETFNGALANMKAALSRIGADVASPALKSFRDLFNTLRPFIDNIHEALKPTLALLSNDKGTGILDIISKNLGGLTKNTKVIGFMTNMIAGLNGALKVFKKLIGPIGNILSGLWNIFEAIGSVIKPIITAFLDIFPVNFSKNISDITASFKKFTEGLKLSSKNSERLRSAFRGVFSVLAIVWDLVKLVAKGIIAAVKTLAPLGDVVFSILGAIGEFLTTISYYFRVVIAIVSYVIGYFGGIDSIFQGLIGLIAMGLSYIFDAIGKLLSPLQGVLSSILSFFHISIKEGSSFGETLDAIFSGLKDWVLSLGDSFSKVGGVIGNIIGKIVSFFKTLFGGGEEAEKTNEQVSNTGKTVQKVEKTIDKANSTLGTFGKVLNWIGSTVGEGLAGFLSGLGSAFSDLVSNINPAVIIGGLFAAVGVKLAFSISKLVDASAGLIKSITAVPQIISNINNNLGEIKKNLKVGRLLAVVQTIAGTILVLVGSLILLSNIPQEKLWGAIGVLGALMAMMLVFAGVVALLSKAMAKFHIDEAMKKVAVSMLSISAASILIAYSIKILEGIKTDGLEEKVKAIQRILLSLGVAVGIINLTSGKDSKSKMATIISVSLSLIVLMKCLKSLGEVDIWSLIKGLVAVVALLNVMQQVVKKMDGVALPNAAGMLAVAIALRLLIPVIKAVIDSVANIKFGVLFAVLAVVLPTILSFFPTIDLIINKVTSTCNKIMNSIKTMAKTLIAISGAIMLLVIAMKMTAILTTDDIVKGLAVISGCFLVFGLLSKLGDKVSKGKWGSFGAGIMQMSAAIMILVGAIAILGFLPDEVLIKGSIVVAGLLVIFAAITVLSAFTARAKPKQAGQMFLMMGGAIAILAAVITILGAIPSKMAYQGLIVVGVIGLIFAGILALTALTKNADPKRLGIMFLELAGAIGAISACVYLIGQLPVRSAVQGVIAVTAISTIIGILTKILSKIKIDDIKSSIVAVAEMIFSIAAITAALMLLSDKPWDSLLAAALAISTVLTTYCLLFKYIISESSKLDWAMLGQFILGLGSVLIISLSMMMIANNPWDKLLASAAAISTVLIAYSLIFKYIIQESNIDLKQMGLFIAGTLALLPIALAIMMLSDKPWQQLLASSLAIIGTLIAYSAVFIAVSKMSGTINLVAMALFVAGTLALIPIAIALNIVADNPWQNLLGAAGAISSALLAYAVVFKIMSTINPAAAIKGAIAIVVAFTALAVAFVAVIGIVGTVIAAIGKINEMMNGDLKNLMESGGAVLKALGEAIGGFFGGIAKGFMVAVAEGMPSLGEGLAGFAKSSKPFFELLKTIDDKSIKAANVIKDVIITLAVAELLNAIKNFLNMFTGGESTLSTLGDNLYELGKAMHRMAEGANGVNPKEIKNFGEAAKTLIEAVDSIPNTGGVAQFFTGETDWKGFSSGIVSLVTGMQSAATAIKEVNISDIEKIKVCGMALAELEDAMPDTNGLVSVFTGEVDWHGFGNGVVSLVSGMVRATNELKNGNLKEEDINKIVTMGKTLAELQKTVPNSGGVVDFFTGHDNLDDFGDDIAEFGKGMKAFSDNVSGFNPEAANAAAAVGSAMARLGGQLPDSFNGEIVDKIKECLPGFGDAVANFWVKLKDLDTTTFTKIKDAATELSNLLNSVSASKVNEGNFKTYSSSLDKLQGIFQNLNDKKYKVSNKKINEFVSGVKKILTAFNKKIKAKDFSEIDKYSSSMKKFSEGLKFLDTANSDNIGKISDNLGSLGKAYSGFTKTIKKSPSKSADTFKITIKKISDSLKDKTLFEGKGLKNLVAFGNSMKHINSVVKATNKGEYDNFSKSLTNISSAYLNFKNELNSKGNSIKSMDHFNTKMKHFIKIFETLNKADVKGANRVTKALKSMTKSLGSMTDKSLAKGEKSLPKFEKLGINMVIRFKNGINKQPLSNVNLITKLYTKLVSNKNLKKIGEAGKDVVDGFIKGVDNPDKNKKLQSSAERIADVFLKKVKKKLKIKSPSKEMEKTGIYTVMGYTKGVSDNISKIYQSGLDFGNAALDGVNDSLGIHSPATKMIEAAWNTAAGWIKGCKGKASEIFKSGGAFGGNFMDGLKGAISKVSKGNFDFTGTKVLDNLKKGLGVGKISEAFGDKKKDSKSASSIGQALKEPKFKGSDKDKKQDAKNKKSINKQIQSGKKETKEYAKWLKQENRTLNTLMIGVATSIGDILGSNPESYKDNYKIVKKKKKVKGKDKWVKKSVAVAVNEQKEFFKAYGIKSEKAFSKGLYSFKNTISSFKDSAVKKAILNSPSVVGTFVKNYKTASSISGVSRSFNKNFSDIMRSDTAANNKEYTRLNKEEDRLAKEEKRYLKASKTTNKKNRKKALSNLAKVRKQRKTNQKKMNAVYSKTKNGQVDALAQTVYEQTSEYKTAKNTLEKEGKNLKSIKSRAKKKTKQVDALDKKLHKFSKKAKNAKSKKTRNKYKKQAKTLEKKLKKTKNSLEKLDKKAQNSRKKMAEAASSLANGGYRVAQETLNKYKEMYQSYVKITNLDFSAGKVLSGMDKMERTANYTAETFDILSKTTYQASLKFNLLDEVMAKATSSLDIFNLSLDKSTYDTANVSSTVANASEAFDVLGVSVDTGINLLEKFTKVGRMTKEALFENARSQLEGYEEFYKAIDQLRETNLNSDLVDELEAEGPAAMNKIRGFLSMSVDERDWYNEQIEKKYNYEARMLEKNLEKQKKTYEKFVDYISKLVGKIPDKMIQKLKESGVSSMDYVRALLHMDDKTLTTVSDMFSISLTKGQEDAVATAAESTLLYSEALKKNNEQQDTYNNLLKKLSEAGYIDDIVDGFREMGSSTESIERINQLLKENGEGIAYINDQVRKSSGYDMSITEYFDDIIKSKEKVEEAKKDLEDLYNNHGLSRELYSNILEKDEKEMMIWVYNLKNQVDKIGEINEKFNKSLDRKPILQQMEEANKQEEKFQKMLKDLSGIGLSTTMVSYIENMGSEEGLLYAEALINDAKKYIQDNSGITVDDIFKGGNSHTSHWLNNYFQALDKVYSKNQKKGITTMTENLKSQVKFLNEYNKDMDVLAKKLGGTNSPYYKYIKDMGIEGAEIAHEIAYAGNYAIEEWKTAYRQQQLANRKETQKSLREQLQARANTNKEFLELTERLEKLGFDRTSLYSLIDEGDLEGSVEKLREISNWYIDDPAGAEKFSNDLANIYKDAGDKAIESMISELSHKSGAYSRNSAKLEELKAPFINIGSNLSDGVLDGFLRVIRNSTSVKEVQEAIKKFWEEAALNPSYDTFEINSPSKVFAEMARFCALGFTEGLSKSEDGVIMSTEDMGDKVMKEFQNTISNINDILTLGGLDLNPVITPTLDLSQVAARASELQNMLESEIEAKGNATLNAQENQNGQTVINFEQTNNSPKALSAEEIYRNTSNGLSRLREAVSV